MLTPRDHPESNTNDFFSFPLKQPARMNLKRFRGYPVPSITVKSLITFLMMIVMSVGETQGDVVMNCEQKTREARAKYKENK